MAEIATFVVDATAVTKWHLQTQEDYLESALRLLVELRNDKIRLLGPGLLAHAVAAAILNATKVRPSRPGTDIVGVPRS